MKRVETFLVMRIERIKGTTNYFIHEDGFCTVIRNGKELLVPLLTAGGRPRVKIEIKRQNLVHLMVEHFIGDLNIKDRITYRIIDGKVPLKHIKVQKISLSDSPDEDAILIFKYKCDVKAKNQNSRLKYSTSITKEDVLNSLKRTNFKCFYCNQTIEPNKWHLDHVVPIAQGGFNVATNITPACKYCNLMKGAIGIGKFLFQCNLIIKNHKELIDGTN